MMTIVCQNCGKEGTLEADLYRGKRLRLKCPYCSSEFIYSVPPVGEEAGPVREVVEGQAATAVPPLPPPAVPLPGVAVPQPAEQQPAVAEQAGIPPARTEADDAIINEAKRIARLIISEIKLYNQERIARAKSKKEVLDILRNDLIKGKQHYNTRVASKLPVGPDYFMESVKEILLGGKQ